MSEALIVSEEASTEADDVSNVPLRLGALDLATGSSGQNLPVVLATWPGRTCSLLRLPSSDEKKPVDGATSPGATLTHPDSIVSEDSLYGLHCWMAIPQDGWMLQLG